MVQTNKALRTTTIAFILACTLLFSTFLYVNANPAEEDLDALTTQAEKWLSKQADHHVERLRNFVGIQSVSADPLRADAVRDAASFLMDELTESGMQNVQLLDTPRHPSVFAEWKPNVTSTSSSEMTTILIYAHYDVQPEDPVDEWTKTEGSPFNAFVDKETRRMYGRGASDDKGSLYTVVAAIRAWITTTKMSVAAKNLHIKVLFEGEEEIGSPNLSSILETHKDLLKADMGFSADGGMVDENTPNICVSLRGALAMEVNVKVAETDMHSGTFGGGVMNPAIALAYLISGLRDAETGKILVKGFYDKVRGISEEDKRDMDAHPTSMEDILKPLGINESVGEDGLNFRERTWTRPSLDVLGIYGGFQGAGVKTVLPREATAKISSRIVADQSSKETSEQIETHLLEAAKNMKGVKVTVTNLGFSSEPAYIDKHSTGNVIASRVLKKLYNGKEPVFVRFGGSIPAMGLLQSKLGIAPTMYAFALGDENVHAPDEFARLDELRKSEIAYVRLFAEIAKQAPSATCSSNDGRC